MNKLEGLKNLVTGGIDATVEFVKDAILVFRPAQRPCRTVNGHQQQQSHQESRISISTTQNKALGGRVKKKSRASASWKKLKPRPQPLKRGFHTKMQNEVLSQDGQQQQEKEEMVNGDDRTRETSVMNTSETESIKNSSSSIVDFTEVEDDNGEEEKKNVVAPIQTTEQLHVALDRHMNWIHDAGKRRVEQILQDSKEGWSREEMVLYRWISLRVFLPLLPLDWRLDFPTLPDDWFTQDITKAKINSISGREFAATHALTNLMYIGGRVRANIFCKIDPTMNLRREINTYIKWAAKDGGYEKKIYVPLIALASPTRHEITTLTDCQLGQAMEQKLARRLEELAARHREFLLRATIPITSPPNGPSSSSLSSSSSSSTSTPQQPPPRKLIHPLPTLYGIVITYAVVLLVSYNAGAATPTPRTLAVFSYKDYDYDVWNASALGMMVCRARDWLIRLDKAIGGFEVDRELLAREAEEAKIDE